MHTLFGWQKLEIIVFHDSLLNVFLQCTPRNVFQQEFTVNHRKNSSVTIIFLLNHHLFCFH